MVSPVLDGVSVSVPIRRSGRKSERSTAGTVSLAVVSTSYASRVTGLPPRRPVLSSGNLRKTESTVVMESSVPVPLGRNDVVSTSKRRMARVTSVSGRLASNRLLDKPSAG
jgi:hypothetical protein